MERLKNYWYEKRLLYGYKNRQEFGGRRKNQSLDNGDMTVYTVAEMKEVFLENLKSCKSMELDLSNVSKIDTAGYQLLLLADLEAGQRNKQLSINSLSDDVGRLFRLYRYRQQG